MATNRPAYTGLHFARDLRRAALSSPVAHRMMARGEIPTARDARATHRGAWAAFKAACAAPWSCAGHDAHDRRVRRASARLRRADIALRLAILFRPDGKGLLCRDCTAIVSDARRKAGAVDCSDCADLARRTARRARMAAPVFAVVAGCA